MSKEKLIPELRFPEFKNDGEWTETILGSVVEMKGRIGYRGYTTEDIVDKGKGAITLSPSNFRENGQLNFDKCTYISWAKYDESPEIQLEEGQTVLVKTASVGKTAYVDKLPEKATVNPQIVVLKPKTIQNRFLSYTVSHKNSQTQIRNNVGAGAIPNISQEIISKIKILIPPDRERKEQQKIATCLSSLDEVIAAHSQKLALLKDHKKALMQNLFPQEGETVPKVRFKEFEKDGEWEEKKLGEVSEIITGSTPSTNESSYYGGNKMFVSPADISDKRIVSQTKTTLTELGFSKTRQIKAGSVLFVCIGSTIGKIAQNEFDCATNQQLNSLIANSDYSNDFLYSILDANSSVIASIAGNHAVPIINKTSFSEVKLFFPPSLQEQQKIASCLSSLDALITAQVQKIEQLKLHKKGLMQGLFPKIRE